VRDGDFSVWYNFREIIKTVAIRFHILKLKCIKFYFGWSFAPGPLWGSFSKTLAGFKGPTYKGKEGRGTERGGKGKG